MSTPRRRELGYTPVRLSGARGHFTMDDLALVQSVFPSARRHVLEGALLFPTPEPALRFYATGRIDGIEDRPKDNGHRTELCRSFVTASRRSSNVKDPSAYRNLWDGLSRRFERARAVVAERLPGCHAAFACGGHRPRKPSTTSANSSIWSDGIVT